MNRKTIIITGGAQGIGVETARYFLSKEWNVAVWDTDREAAEELASRYKNTGLFVIPVDISSEKEVSMAVDQTIRKFGQIDVLVNNAAIACNKPLSEITVEEWKRVIDVNLSGPFICSKYCETELRKSKGRIINLASTRALQSEANTEAYSASKGGIVALTHALAVSLGPDILVNAISPGWIDVSAYKKERIARQELFSDADHSQHPAGRVGGPGDIVRMIEFLADEQNSFITGQNFIIDGGMTRKMIYC